jgi:hypothetical protein
MLRIRDVYTGSRIQIFLSRIQIPDPGSGSASTNQCCGTGSGLYPDSVGSLDPYPYPDPYPDPYPRGQKLRTTIEKVKKFNFFVVLAQCSI